MTDDGRLLRDYVRQGSQAAFSALVARHLNFVYSVCLRETSDAALAEEVTQVVFLILARKAPSLRPEPSLTGWLFQTARFAARNARRRASRRQEWEEKALAQTQAPGGEDAALWDQIRPALNDALASLGAKDRQAVLLRFADGLSFPELGAALGTSEDAARMRLNRAVERLRQFFAKEGVTLSGLVLSGMLTGHTVQAAPTACAASVARIAESVPAGGSSGGLSPQVHSQLQGVWKAMTISKLKIAAIIGIGALLASSLPFVTRAQNLPVSAVTIAPIVTSSTPISGSLDAFVLPGAQGGNSGTVSQMQIKTYTLVQSYEEVCQFYSRAFLDGDFKTLGVTGARGNNETHSVYALHQNSAVRTSVFCQRTPKYIVSAFVTRSTDENNTEVTLVYEPR